jgi:hypothetical protein
MKHNKRKAIDFVGIAVMFLSLIFIVKVFLSFDIEFSSLFSPRYILFLSMSLIAATLATVFNAFSWKMTIEFFSGNKASFLSAFHVYAKSNLGKYLPGKVGHYAYRQLFGTFLGMSQTQLAVASVFEFMYIVAVALLLSFISARNEIYLIIKSLFPELNISLIFSVGIITGISAASILFFLFRQNTYTKDILTLIKTKGFWTLLLKILVIISTNFLFIGSVFALIVGIHTPLTASSFAVIFATCVTSWLIGFVVPGVPGGIGVREAALTLMLSHLYPEEVILTAAVFQRLTMVGGDVAAWIISAMLINKR